MRFRTTVVGATLLGAAFCSSALTLGRMNGSAVLGQPVDVTIDVRLEAGEEIGCLAAEVFHADAAVDGGRVRAVVQPGGSGETVRVRIVSSAVVDEPTVAVALRAGCTQQTMRRYVMLADLPASAGVQQNVPGRAGAPVVLAQLPQLPSSELPAVSRRGAAGAGAGMAPAATLPAMPAPAATGDAGGPGSPNPPPAAPDAPVAVVPRGAAEPPRVRAAAAPVRARPGRIAAAEPARARRSAAAPRARSTVAAAEPARRSRVARADAVPRATARPSPARSAPAAPAAPAVRQAAASASPTARLQLDPAELVARPGGAAAAVTPTADVEGAARPGGEPPAAGTEGQPAAAGGSAATQPEDLQRDARRLESLEAETRTLREIAQRNQDALLQLQAARGATPDVPRYLYWLLYALGALLLLALATIGWLWRRARQNATARQWWHDSLLENASRSAGASSGGPVLFSTVQPSQMPPVTEVDIDLSLTPSAAADLLPLPAATPLGSAPAVAASAALGAAVVQSEELFDVQQHADFFVSLGQYDQAVAVLQHHIDDAPAASPLAYLDLLKIFHTLNRQADYEQVRANFNRIFNAHAPAFEGFDGPSRALEDYSAAVVRIQKAWAGTRALAALETMMFRKPQQPGEAFALDAFRELLLLHAIAKSLVQGGPRTGVQDGSGPLFSESRPAPLAPPMRAARAVPRSAPTEPARVTSYPSLDAVAPSGYGSLPMDGASAMLDLDLSQPAPLGPASGPASAPQPPAHADRAPGPSPMSRLLPDDPSMPAPVAAAEAVDSGMVDFDLFDIPGREKKGDSRK